RATACPAADTLPLHDALPIFPKPSLPTEERWALKNWNCRKKPIQWWDQPTASLWPFQPPAFHIPPPFYDRFAMTRPFHSPNTTLDRKSTRLNSSHVKTSYAVF